MGSKKRSFGCGGNRKKRADRVVRPYMVRRKIVGTGGQGHPPLQGAAENRTNGRTGSSAPTGAAENRRNGRTESSAPTGEGEDRRL